MTDRRMIEDALRAAGVETGPKRESYVNPRLLAPEEPVEQQVEEQQETPTPARTTSTRPVPVGDVGKAPAPTGGHDPFALPEPDRRAEARKMADHIWQREHGLIPPTLTVHPPEGRRI